MQTLFFKPTIPVEMHEIKELLEKEFPEYEYSLYGVIGKKGLMIKKSTFKGARVGQAGGRIIVSKTPPTIIGSMIDRFFFGLISSYTNDKIACQIVTLLKERYC